MTPTAATAPGKAILLGEHAVVYDRPAIAIPVAEVQARCEVSAGDEPGIVIEAIDQNRRYRLSDAPEEDPLAAAVRLTLASLDQGAEPDLRLRITSTVPQARGLGSGAAISTAVVRALAQHQQRPLSAHQVSGLVFEIEKMYHGTPSGVDNTIVAFAQPAYFVRGRRWQRLTIAAPFTFVIGDTGVVSPTRTVVADLRRRWQADRERYEAYFDQVEVVVNQARLALKRGEVLVLGRLLDENQAVLAQLGVSSLELDTLITAARRAGALGAKLTGAGRGGNMLAVVEPARAGAVVSALRQNGAVNTIITTVQ
jgi:mevalonate kinase